MKTHFLLSVDSDVFCLVAGTGLCSWETSTRRWQRKQPQWTEDMSASEKMCGVKGDARSIIGIAKWKGAATWSSLNTSFWQKPANLSHHTAPANPLHSTTSLWKLTGCYCLTCAMQPCPPLTWSLCNKMLADHCSTALHICMLWHCWILPAAVRMQNH